MGATYKNGASEVIGLSSADWTEETRAVALAQLARIVESPHFHSSKRCSHFLRYIVEHTVSSHPDPLKERTLGIEIFGRDVLYDTAQDPVVRITAGEVRKRLAQYYQEPGRQQEPRISLPPGGYVPEIHGPPAVQSSPEVGPRAKEAETMIPTRKVSPWTFAAGAGVLALTALTVLLAIRLRQTDLDRFWAPFLHAQEPVIVCVGQPRVYVFEQRVQTALNHWFENGAEAGRKPPEIAAVPLEDIVPAWSRNISLAEADAFSRISRLLAQKGQEVRLRGVRETSLTNLRGKPCILVGAFNNEWTIDLTGQLRFYFETSADLSANFVRDRRNPDKSDWKVEKAWPRPNPPTDYAIVSRVESPTTEQAIVTIGGITVFGTEAASEFLTNEAYLAEALKQAPKDWQRKNMQVVLATTVLSGTAGPPRVLAVHFW